MPAGGFHAAIRQPNRAGETVTAYRAAALAAVAVFPVAMLSVIFLQYGIGLNHDSTIYLAAARALHADGRFTALSYATGLSAPVIGYPPLYSVVLAALVPLTGTPETAAVAVSTFCLAVTVFLTFLLVMRGAGVSSLAALGAAVTVALSVDLFALACMALSEPLFLLLLLAAWLALARALQTRTLPPVVLSACLFAAAWLTRYAGMAALAAGALALLLHPAFAPRRRALALALFIIIGTLPPALWSLRNYAVAGTAAGRTLAWHPVSTGHLRMGAGVVTKWIFPQAIPPAPRALLFALFVAVAAGLALHIVRRAGLPLRLRTLYDFAVRRPAVLITAIFVAVYVPFLLVSISLVDAHTPLDHRLLAPVFLALVIACWTAGERLCSLARSRAPRAYHLAGVGLVILGTLLAGSFSLRYSHIRATGEGVGFARWRHTAIISAVRRLPAGVPIYSNGQDIIYALTGRPAVTVPYKLNPNTQLTIDPTRSIATLADRLRRHHGLLVMLDEVKWRYYLVTTEDIRRQVPLISMVTIPGEGAIYRVAGDTAAD